MKPDVYTFVSNARARHDPDVKIVLALGHAEIVFEAGPDKGYIQVFVNNVNVLADIEYSHNSHLISSRY
jgi:hypothetical protein